MALQPPARRLGRERRKDRGSQTGLLARGTRTMKRCSFNARSRAPSGCPAGTTSFPIAGKGGVRGARAIESTPVLWRIASCPPPGRREKKRYGWPDGTSCSRNADGETVLAWDKSASRRALGWAGENVARSKVQFWPFPLPLLLRLRRRCGKPRRRSHTTCLLLSLQAWSMATTRPVRMSATLGWRAKQLSGRSSRAI